ncbi:MAG: site-specific integrase, partial [Flavobacteriales bacterium]
KIILSEWDSVKGKARGNKQESRLLNRYLDLVKNRIYEAHDQLLKENIFICSQSIKARFLGEDNEEYSLLTLIDYHNTQMSESLTYGTLKNYFTTQRYIKLFLTTKRKTQDIYLSRLTYRFLVDFERFLRSYVPTDHQKRMENNTVMKHIQRLRKMVTLAYKMEWIEKDPFIKFKPTYIKNEREYLREDELQNIIDRDFEFERLTLVKDLFLFSCYTGLSYIDVMNLNEDNIAIGIDGARWIITNRQKTHNKVKIPILSQAKELIEKYRFHIKTKKTKTLFPNISNQKLNAYLKEIADLCGINKNLTFHIARHTFATTITLSNGVPIETVSKLLGHTKITTTQIYAKVIETKVSQDMMALSLKMERNKKENINKNDAIG